MRITFAVPAHLTSHWSHPNRDEDYLSVLPELHGMRLTPDTIEPYLDEELLFAGVVGGEIYGAIDQETTDPQCPWEGLQVHVVFRAPAALTPELMAKLEEEASGQIKDGIGEQGFDVMLEGKQRMVNFNSDAEVRLHSVVDDGRLTQPPSQISVAVRRGEQAATNAAIAAYPDQVNVPLGGYSPLHMAILKGMVDVVELLITAGADVKALDPNGNTSLQNCAWVRDPSDEQCTHIARLLLMGGVDKDHRTELFGTAMEGAQKRNRPKLAALLADFGP